VNQAWSRTISKQKGSLSDEYVSVYTSDNRAAGNITKLNKMAETRQRL
jgi:hypothetical protein